MNLVLTVNKTGYGVTGQNILKGLYDKGQKVALWPIGGVEYEQEIDEAFKAASKNIRTYDKNAPSLRLYHLFDMALFPGRGKKFGFPIYELDTFTEDEIESIKSLDHMFHCSQWSLDIAKKYSDIPMSVIPLGVNRSVFCESQNPTNTKTTMFLSCGKWEKRKGHDIIVKAFNAAFNKKDDVCLVMNCINPFIGNDGNLQWTSLYKSSPLGDKIHIVEERLNSQHDVANLMRVSDCGIFPVRSEGWNLELLEMMSCGKHVIATNYSAHTEFVNNKNCKLIDIDKLESAYDNVWFNGQGNWAHLGQNQFDQLVEHMKKIHQLKQEDRLTINYEGIKTAKKFSWENTADKLIEEMGK